MQPGKVLKAAGFAAALLTIVCSVPRPAAAGVCVPNASNVVAFSTTAARRRSMQGTATLAQFAACPSNQSGVPFGPNPPALCFIHHPDSASGNASLIFSMASQNITANGCSWPCAGGCIVRGGDALPVELLGFGVD